LEKTTVQVVREINIAKHQIRFKEDLEEMQVEIPKIKVINVTKINKWIVMPNLKLQTIKFTRKIIEDRLPPNYKKRFFIFEAKDIPEAPRVLVKFLGKCICCLEAEGGGSSTQT
jgi:hypothetical protein